MAIGRRIWVGLFLLLLILIPSVLGLLRTQQKVLSESTHIAFASPIPTLSPIPTPTPTPISTPTPTLTPSSTIIPQPKADRPLDETATPTPIPIPTANPGNDDVWEKLAKCESDGNWTADTGNSYFGGLQFSQSAWESVGGTGKPSSASRDEQIAKGKLLQQQRGWSPWGGCGKQLGLE